MSESHPLKLLQSIDVKYSPTKVYLWRSERTGLQTVLIQQENTLVHGYFAVGSEIHNDSGCPHTLEHLVFMGSKKYPYKGLLDTIGNKMMSNTNAWTAVDQTVYTLSTVGWEAFSSLLPVYIDHVMNPTLTDASCLTEVFYIDGNGEEKGVVFSEMQGIENSADSIEELHTQKLLYGDKSAYSSETGGLMGALRVLQNDQIREFHKKIYRPDNFSIIISGDIPVEEYEAALRKIDDSLPSLPKEKHPRQFVDTEPKEYPGESIVQVVEFPENDETFGNVSITWIGPSTHHSLEADAIQILLKYLTFEGIGALSKEIVDIPDPLATDVYYDSSFYLNQEFNLSFSNVAKDNLNLVYTKAMDIIKQVAESPETFDLEHVRQTVERTKYQDIKNCESSANAFADTAIVSFLYGNLDGSSLRAWVEDVKDYDILMEWDAQKWCDLLKTNFVENPSVAILTSPSKELSDKLKKETKDRISATKKKYGPEGLAELQKRADEAQEINNKPVPQSVLNEFKSPDLTKIKFIETTFARGGTALKLANRRKQEEEETSNYKRNDTTKEIEKIIKDNTPEDFPLYICFEHFKSQFVTVRVLLSTRLVDEELLPLVDVFFSELFALPIILEDGKTVLSFEDTMKQLKAETIRAEVPLGISSDFNDYLTVTVQTRADKYSDAIKWVRRALYQSQFTDDRIKAIMDKHVNRLSEYKRKGSFVARSLVNRSLFQSRSIIKSSDLFETEDLFRKFQEEEEEKGVEEIRGKLEKIRKQLVCVENQRVYVAGDVTKLHDVVKSWEKMGPLQNNNNNNDDEDKTKKKQKPVIVDIPFSREVLELSGKGISKTAKIASMPSTESSYGYVLTAGPSDYNDSDLPSLLTACEYLDAVEGPIWRGVRGAGYAYGASVYISLESATVRLNIYRGADIGKAIESCERMIEDYCSGATPIEEHMLEGAKNMVAHSEASSRQNASSTANLHFCDYELRGREDGYVENLLESISKKVTKESVVEAMKKYLMPLFDSKTSMVFIACHESMTEGVCTELKKKGYDVHVEEVQGGHGDESEGEETGSDSEEEEED